MLITLRSNSDSDAHNFTNFFKEPVQIQPNSELALVSICYKFDNSYVVSAANYHFQVQLGTDLLNCYVANGTYNTSDEFLGALNTALTTAINNSTYQTLLTFPDTDNYFSWADGNKTQIKLTLSYSPQDWDNTLLIAADGGDQVQQEVAVDNAAMIDNDGDGILVRVSTATSGWATNTAISEENDIWGTAYGNPTDPYGSITFRALGDNYNVFVGASFNIGAITPSNAWVAGISTELACGIRLVSDGTFEIEEYDSSTGNLETITTTGINYERGDTFEIRFPQVGDTITNPSYYQNSIKITSFEPTANRLELDDYTVLYCRVSLYDQKNADSIPSATTDVIDIENTVIAGAGTGYKKNDVVLIHGNTSGKEVLGYITGIDANGGITGYSIVEHVDGWTNAETATVTGTVSGNANATLTIATDAATELTAAGSGYTAAAADVYASDDTTLLQAGGLTIDSVDGGGAITGYTFADDLANLGITNLSYVLHIHQGGSDNLATITVHATNNEIARVGGVAWTTILDTDTTTPLTKHQNEEFTPQGEFSDLTLMYAANSDGPTLIVEGQSGVNSDRQTDTMLVNVDQFQISSICKDGGVQKAVAVVPYGSRSPGDTPTEKLDGVFYEEPFNLLYHTLGNKQIENHNQIQVRLTDAVGNPLEQLLHPTTLTLDLRPKAN